MAVHHSEVPAFDVQRLDAFPSCSLRSPGHFVKMKACAACWPRDSPDESEGLLGS